MARSALLPTLLAAAGLLALLRAGSAFVPAPAAAEVNVQGNLRAAAVSAGAAVLSSGALPALAEDIDSAEAYNRKVMTGVAVGLSLSFFLLGLVISQARKLVENRWLN